MKLIDMHCDTITVVDDLYQNNGHIDLKRLIEADYAMQCFAVFILLDKQKSPYQACKKYIQFFHDEMDKYKDYVSQIRNYQQLVDNIQANKLSALLTIEEGATIEGSLEKLKEFYDDGVRMMTLTWNFENEIGFPNIPFHTTPDHPETEKGLKDFGREVVTKMNELGMIVDCSHGSDKLFYDCIEVSSKPIVCSHSDSRVVWNHYRNLTDDMIETLANHGGMTGINYCPRFVSGDTTVNQMPMLIEHMKHITNVGGYDVLGFGSDFDGITTPVGMDNCLKVVQLQEMMADAGFTSEQIEKICYKNFLRVFEANCK